MNHENTINPTFSEVQKFRQFWIWAVVIAISGLMWYAWVEQLLMHRPFGDRPMPDILLFIFWLIFGIGLPALFLYGKLIIQVNSDGIYIRFYPFHSHFHKIAFKELKRYEVRNYRPILEYGGWGIRSGLKGKAYNVSGNGGVQLELTNGKRILIGSQRPEELWQAIQAESGVSREQK